MLASAPWSDDLIRSVVAGFFWRQPSQADVDRYASVVRSCSGEAAVESLRSNAQSDTLDRLKDLRVPTLIVKAGTTSPERRRSA